MPTPTRRRAPPAALLAAALLAAAPARGQAIETAAPQAFLLDYSTGSVLLARGEDAPMPPASMSKLMTVYLAFEAVREGRFTLGSMLPVSRGAWEKGGSKMFVEVGTEVSLEDLLRGIIVQSGNDACIVVAEAIAGTEDRFAELMNLRARELGLTNSNFANSTGWPDPDHWMSPRDLATLTVRLLEDFPEYFPMFAEMEFTYGGIRQSNRNPLLYRNMGADGMKTGHTEASGFGLAATAVRGGRRLILVVNGLGSQKERTTEATRLMELGFGQFARVGLAGLGEPLGAAPVWLGAEEEVPLVSPAPLSATLPRGPMRRETEFVIRYEGPVEAPVARGQELATLVIRNPALPTREVPLHAGREVPRVGLFGRLTAAVSYLVWGSP